MTTATATVPQEFEALLEYLKRTRGFDVTAYKRSTLMRRVQKRMQSVDVTDFASYQDYLEVHPDEFAELFNTILINVTSFFRDQGAWDFLRTQIVPAIIAGKGPAAPIRVWGAGCASGEEAYSVAMLLAEALGPEMFRARVKIYATDVDEDTLTEARSGSYSARDVENIPADLRAKYFEPAGERFIFNKELRRGVIFGRHDLLKDAPISRIDLLICRNTLMYFNAEAQERILARFHFALEEGGYLFLGKAETLLAHGGLFVPVEMPHRLFARSSRGVVRERLLLTSQAGPPAEVPPVTNHSRLREAAFDTGPLAQIVVDANGVLVAANEAARALFRLTQRDINRPLQDLEVSYRPMELRSRIEQAYSQRHPVVAKDVECTSPAGGALLLDVRIAPLLDGTGTPYGASITFSDVTSYKRLQEELYTFNQELETAYEELQSTNEELQTTNEELQSTIEELETTNEELQCTNEELETMNEELQSTNEELETMNQELRQRGEELNRTNRFLALMLSSLREGIVVVDREMRILDWNRRAEELWGLRADEVRNHHFLNLDIGLPVEQLRQPIRNALGGDGHDGELTLPARNRRGRAIRCRVTCTPMTEADQVEAVLMVMEEIPADGAGEPA